MIIKFLKPMPPYATGELANVSEMQAHRLIKLGVAEVFKQDIKEEVTEEVVEDTKQVIAQKDKMVRKAKEEK